MKLINLKLFLFILNIISIYATVTEGNQRETIKNYSAIVVTSNISERCYYATEIDQANCVHYACMRWKCQTRSDKDFCGYIWEAMDCITNLVNGTCPDCSEDDKYELREHNAKVEKELKTGQCKDYPRSPSSKQWPNLIAIFIALNIILILK